GRGDPPQGRGSGSPADAGRQGLLHRCRVRELCSRPAGFGGHGYIREWGQEQLVRDVRIAQIYEGTNGIQALDLMGRKTVANGGAYFKVFADEIRGFIADNDAGEMQEFVQPLAAALDNLQQLTDLVIERSRANPNEIGAAS